MKGFRSIVDCGMAVLMFLLLTFPWTGSEIHEVVGLIMAALFVIHLVRNRRWWKALLKGRWTAYRIIWTGADLALCVDMALLAITGISMAGDILPRHLIPIPRETAQGIHIVAGYLAFLLMSFHAGLHLQSLFRKIRKGKGWILLLLALCAGGIWSFFHNHFDLYLTGRAHFVFVDGNTPVALYEAELFLIAVLPLSAAFLVQTYLTGSKKGKP